MDGWVLTRYKKERPWQCVQQQYSRMNYSISEEIKGQCGWKLEIKGEKSMKSGKRDGHELGHTGSCRPWEKF